MQTFIEFLDTLTLTPVGFWDLIIRIVFFLLFIFGIIRFSDCILTR